MFGLFEKIVDVAIDTALLPVDVAKDAVTMGGSLVDEETPYTIQKLGKITKKLDNLTEDV